MHHIVQADRGSSTQQLSDSWTTKINVTEIVESKFDPSTNHRFTPQTAGKYYIYGQVTNSTSSDL